MRSAHIAGGSTKCESAEMMRCSGIAVSSLFFKLRHSSAIASCEQEKVALLLYNDFDNPQSALRIPHSAFARSLLSLHSRRLSLIFAGSRGGFSLTRRKAVISISSNDAAQA